MKKLSKRKSSNFQACYSPKKVNAVRSRSINSPNITKTKRITPYRASEPPQPIPSYIKRENLNNKNSNNNSQESTPLINDSYCIELRDKLMSEGIIVEDIDYNDLPNLSEHLREYTASKSYERDYTTAKKSKELYDQVKEKMKYQNTYYTNNNNDNDDQNMKLIEDKMNEQKAELEKFDEETEEKLQNLQKKHEEETEYFEKKWTEELPQSYRKQSSKLIQLFEIEKTLGLLNEFDKANQIKDEANKLEESEMQEAQRKMESDYEMQRSTFDNSYMKDVQNIEQTRESQRNCIIARHKFELKQVQNRINVLNDHQRQNKRPKESSFDIQSRAPVNSSLISIIRGVSFTETSSNSESKSKSNTRPTSKSQASKLLPPLIPPNDARVKERKKKERRDRIEKNKKFRERMIAKEREEEERYNESLASSPRNEGNCFDDMLKRLDNLAPKNKPNKTYNEPQNVEPKTSPEENTKENTDENTNDNADENTNENNEATDLISSMIQKIDMSNDILQPVSASDETKMDESGTSEVQNVNPETFNLTQSTQFQTQKD